MLNALIDGHDQLRRTFAELNILLALPSPPEDGQLGKLRWALTRELMEHLYLEESCVFDRLRASPVSDYRDRTAAFREAVKPLHEDYLDHMRRWQGSISAAQWKEYVADSRALLVRYEQQMTLEEAELYPMLEESGLLKKAS